MIYISCNVKEDFTKYSGGNTELAIMHIRLFKSILDKCNCCKKQEIAQITLDMLQLEYNALDMHASTCGKKLKQDLEKVQNKVKGYVDTAFKYFQDLLDESLVQEWNQVVHETCHTKGYVGHGGVCITDKRRGFCFDSLDACLRAWLLEEFACPLGDTRTRPFYSH